MKTNKSKVSLITNLDDFFSDVFDEKHHDNNDNTPATTTTEEQVLLSSFNQDDIMNSMELEKALMCETTQDFNQKGDVEQQVPGLISTTSRQPKRKREPVPHPKKPVDVAVPAPTMSAKVSPPDKNIRQPSIYCLS